VLKASNQRGTPASVDWELALAQFREFNDAKANAQRWLTSAKRSAEEIERHERWVIEQFPGTSLAADSELSAIARLSAQNRHLDAARATVALVTKYPQLTEVHGRALNELAKTIRAADVPPEVKLAIAETIVPILKDRSVLAAGIARALHKLPIPHIRRFELLQKIALSCGNYPQCREALWQSLREAAAELGQARVHSECRAFVEHFGLESAAGREAHAVLLRASAAAGDSAASKELQLLEAEDRRVSGAVAVAFGGATRSLDAGDGKDAARLLEGVASTVPAYATEDAWLALLGGPALTDAPAAKVLPVLRVLVERAPEGEALDKGAGLLRRLKSDRNTARLSAKLLARHALDRDRSCYLADEAIKAVELAVDDASSPLEAYRNAAAVARRVGATDRLVHYLIGLGKVGWALSTKEARDALREAAAWYPAFAEAAEAGWLLALLEGKNGVVQGPLPRDPRIADRIAELPKLALPAGPPPSAATRTTPTGVTLNVQDPRSDLLARRLPRASTGQETAALAVDGDPATAWQPKELPASLLVPLAQRSSLAKLRISADGPLYYQASLLDCQGLTLSRVERDWSFVDSYRSAKYWPPPDETLNVLPVAGVCFVRLDVFASSGVGPRISAVQAYASPVQSQAVHLGQPVSLDGARFAQVTFRAEQPLRKVSYDASGEWARGFPIVRWLGFWARTTGPVKLKSVGGVLATSFFGTNASLVLDEPGAVGCQLDDGPETLVSHPMSEQAAHDVASELAPGLHVLKVRASSLPRAKDQEGPAESATRFVRMDVDGVSRVRVALRFGAKGGRWGAWSESIVAPGGAIRAPDSVAGARPELVQAGAFFDAREVRGLESATLSDLVVRPSIAQGTPARLTAWHEPPELPENMTAVADALARRSVVVTYPKTGTRAEYEAAQRLAQKANVYLVSDDVGLNLYGGPVLAVGTPLRSRYARQLLATNGVWNTPGFFADADGVIANVSDSQQKPFFYAVTGDTPSATVRAAERLLARVPQAKPSAALRVFPSSTLDELYPWQLRTDSPRLSELNLRMGIDDRRSAVLGLTVDVAKPAVTVRVSEPINERGVKLPKPIIRPVGYYEWVPFYGDLRLPNLLLEDATFPMPANTARAVWVTAVTPPGAEQGLYRAEVTISAEGENVQVPLLIRVEPVKLPRQTKTATYSFEYPPYWYDPSSATYDAALRAIARDEAAHGVTHVGPELLFDWTVAPQTSPAAMVQGENTSLPTTTQWEPYSERAKPLKPGGALLVKLAARSTVHEALVVVRAPVGTPVALAYWNGQAWARLPTQRVPVGGIGPSALSYTANVTTQFLRFSAEEGAAVSVEKVVLFREGGPVMRFDFAALDREMQIYEEEYRSFGLSPRFIVHSGPRLNQAAAEFSGIYKYDLGGSARLLGPALRAHLATNGRLERTLLKIDDEPRSFEIWASHARRFRDAGLRTMTCHTGDAPSFQSVTGLMNPWCPNYTTDPLKPFFKERQKQGDQLWWYTYGPPNMRITGARADNLAFHWLTAKYGFDGEMTFAALHASRDTMPVPFRYENGQSHRVAFLPDGRLLDTPRRELEAEGINDIKLIELVRQASKALAGRAPKEGRAILAELDRVLRDLLPDRYTYSVEPNDWEAARSTLYDLALRAATPSSPGSK
jgi:hypothetical protein